MHQSGPSQERNCGLNKGKQGSLGGDKTNERGVYEAKGVKHPLRVP